MKKYLKQLITDAQRAGHDVSIAQFKLSCNKCLWAYIAQVKPAGLIPVVTFFPPCGPVKLEDLWK